MSTGPRSAPADPILHRPGVSSAVVQLPDDGRPVRQIERATAERSAPESDQARAAADFAQELAGLRSEAQTRGYEDGRKAAVESVKKEWAEHFAQAGRVLESLKRRREDLLLALEDDLAAIVFEAAAKLVGQTQLQKDRVAPIVRAVVERVVQQDDIVVRIAPADLAYVDPEQMRKELGRMVSLRLVPDEGVLLGGCIVESAVGTLDARLEVQIARLREVLLAARAGGSDTAGGLATGAPAP